MDPLLSKTLAISLSSSLTITFFFFLSSLRRHISRWRTNSFFFPPFLLLLLDSFQQFPSDSVMNASTETAPDIRVAVPLRDFLVRTFAPFRVNQSCMTEERRKTRAVRVDTVVLHARGEGILYIEGTDRESGTSICTRHSSCSTQKHGPHL